MPSRPLTCSTSTMCPSCTLLWRKAIEITFLSFAVTTGNACKSRFILIISFPLTAHRSTKMYCIVGVNRYKLIGDHVQPKCFARDGFHSQHRSSGHHAPTHIVKPSGPPISRVAGSKPTQTIAESQNSRGNVDGMLFFSASSTLTLDSTACI